VFDPAVELDWTHRDPAPLAGGEPADNARIVLQILEGTRTDVARSAVVLNAAAAIYLSGLAESIRDAVDVAGRTIDEGKGVAALDRLRVASAAAKEL
jgi:anthranilate phosphoribosyltransferase